MWEKSTVFRRVSLVMVTPGTDRRDQRVLLTDQISVSIAWMKYE